jgi:hypothetical protein
MIVTEHLRELARAVIAAEDRADRLIADAADAVCSGRWDDARDLIVEAAELNRSARTMRARA